jgi:hypothetical protein
MLIFAKAGLKPLNMSPSELSDIMRLPLHYILFDTPIIALAAKMAGTSRGDIRRKIRQGSLFVGNEKIVDLDDVVSSGNVVTVVSLGKEPVGIIMPIKNATRCEVL